MASASGRQDRRELTGLQLTLLDPHSNSWPDDVDRLRQTLGAPRNPTLFPPHFLKTTLPGIGGHVVRIAAGEMPVAGGFLFPRAMTPQGRVYTLRLHRVPGAAAVDLAELAGRVEALLDASCVILDPAAGQRFQPTAEPAGDLEIGRPNAAEAQAIRDLQQRIWQAEPDYLYPADIHSVEFRLGAPLVARRQSQLAGFLFGFYSFTGPALPDSWQIRSDFRLESQAMGVAPEQRGRSIATLLKSRQAEIARQEGIELVHWTFDPLQFSNAALNLGRLRAVAYTFYADYYAFSNLLNRVRASRLRITWLVASRRVRQALSQQPAEILDLAGRPDIRPVNRGWADCWLDIDAPQIAIEIPAGWTSLQQQAPDEALRWRDATDRLFAHYLGRRPGRYILTDVGRDGPRCYLVAERVGPALLERLAHGARPL